MNGCRHDRTREWFNTALSDEIFWFMSQRRKISNAGDFALMIQKQGLCGIDREGNEIHPTHQPQVTQNHREMVFPLVVSESLYSFRLSRPLMVNWLFATRRL